MVKWLFEKFPNIDISNENECAFKKACEKGHVKVAKWLLETKPDIIISIDDHNPFRTACTNGRTLVAKWLEQLKPQAYNVEEIMNMLEINMIVMMKRMMKMKLHTDIIIQSPKF